MDPLSTEFLLHGAGSEDLYTHPESIIINFKIAEPDSEVTNPEDEAAPSSVRTLGTGDLETSVKVTLEDSICGQVTSPNHKR